MVRTFYVLHQLYLSLTLTVIFYNYMFWLYIFQLHYVAHMFYEDSTSNNLDTWPTTKIFTRSRHRHRRWGYSLQKAPSPPPSHLWAKNLMYRHRDKKNNRDMDIGQKVIRQAYLSFQFHWDKAWVIIIANLTNYIKPTYHSIYI